MLSVNSFLASQAQPSDLFNDLLPWLLVLLAVAIVGAVVLYFARRLFQDDAASMPAEGFTLHQLRQLHAAGTLDDEEFERAKAQLIGRLAGPPGSENDEADGADSPGNRSIDP